MSKSTGLAIAAAVSGVLAIVCAMVAGSSYNSGLQWRSPRHSGTAADAAAAAAIPSGLAWVFLAATVLCIILALVVRQPRPSK